ncbi:MAG: helix-turn-helix domain-containing protein [Clostridium sp.]|nr:helix-turn-helix domain-containing protein [Clostridium sp.]
MYKMLIAEMDQQQTELLKEYTESNFKDIEIVGVERSGAATLNYISNNHVDILVIAVHLEGIIGLEVIRRIRKQNKEIHIVVISEYDYSDFVIKAMNLGVRDYLLKPVKQPEFLVVIQRFIEELKKKILKEEKKNEIEQKDDKISIFADYSFIYSLLWGDTTLCLLENYREVLSIGRYGYIMNIEFVKTGDGCVVDLENDFKIIYQVMKDVISPTNMCVVGPKIGKRIIIYVNQSDRQAGEKDNALTAIALANKIRSEMIESYGIVTRIGIGGVKLIEEIRGSYEEAIKSLRYMEECGVVHSKDVASGVVSHKNYADLETKFLQTARYGREDCLEYFRLIMDLIRPLNINEVRNKVLELLIMACHEVRTQYENETNYLDYFAYMEEIHDFDWNQLKEWAYLRIEYIIKSIRNIRGSKKSAVVTEAMAYIQENYEKEELTLEFIAKYVNVTPQHFSKIFKEETKCTYVEWLANIRMEKAKRLLLQGNMSIRDVGSAVGINDANYFSRKFKKLVGVSPTNFVSMDAERS